MKNPIKTFYKKDLLRRFSVVYRKGKEPLHNYIYDAKSTQERLLVLKAREIIDELTQIMIFVKKIEEFGFDNSETLKQIQGIQSKLRGIETNNRYIQTMHILTKYLSGIRKFAATTHLNGILFYKKLFESALIAITRELDYLEEDIY